jgi:hypothetical protein
MGTGALHAYELVIGMGAIHSYGTLLRGAQPLQLIIFIKVIILIQNVI